MASVNRKKGSKVIGKLGGRSGYDMELRDQSDRVKKESASLAKSKCSLLVNGRCTLTDKPCVYQSETEPIGQAHCGYFKDSVLPNDKELEQDYLPLIGETVK